MFFSGPTASWVSQSGPAIRTSNLTCSCMADAFHAFIYLKLFMVCMSMCHLFVASLLFCRLRLSIEVPALSAFQRLPKTFLSAAPELVKPTCEPAPGARC